MHRVFVAIPVPVDTVSDLVNAVRSNGDQTIRPISVATAHLTLAFLGNLDDASLDTVALALQNVYSKSFEVVLDRVASFPSRGSPRVMVLLAQEEDTLTRLFHSVRSSLQSVVEKLPDRFRPHVTLARARRSGRVRLENLEMTLRSRVPKRFVADRFNLYSSVTEPEGAKHSVLISYPLALGAS